MNRKPGRPKVLKPTDPRINLFLGERTRDYLRFLMTVYDSATQSEATRVALRRMAAIERLIEDGWAIEMVKDGETKDIRLL